MSYGRHRYSNGRGYKPKDEADHSSANYYKNANATEEHGYSEVPSGIYGGTSNYYLKGGGIVEGKDGLSKSEVIDLLRIKLTGEKGYFTNLDELLEMNGFAGVGNVESGEGKSLVYERSDGSGARLFLRKIKERTDEHHPPEFEIFSTF